MAEVLKNDMNKMKNHPAFLAYSRSQVPSITSENTELKNVTKDMIQADEDQQVKIDEKKDQTVAAGTSNMVKASSENGEGFKKKASERGDNAAKGARIGAGIGGILSAIPAASAVGLLGEGNLRQRLLQAGAVAIPASIPGIIGGGLTGAGIGAIIPTKGERERRKSASEIVDEAFEKLATDNKKNSQKDNMAAGTMKGLKIGGGIGAGLGAGVGTFAGTVGNKAIDAMHEMASDSAPEMEDLFGGMLKNTKGAKIKRLAAAAGLTGAKGLLLGAGLGGLVGLGAGALKKHDKSKD